MNKGSCLCEKVKFAVAGSLGEVRYCHCSQCRRITGSAFSANAKISKDCFDIEAGKSLIKEFEHKPGVIRAFCSNCGSPVYSRLDADPQNIRVRLGSFSEAQGVDITAVSYTHLTLPTTPYV